MKVVFTRRTERRLQQIRRHIAADDPAAAGRVIERIVASAEMPATRPRLGWPWQGGPTRAPRVPGLPYRLHYRIDAAAERIEVVTVAHLRQLPPRIGG